MRPSRRVYLDTIGTLPTVAEVRRFLADPAPDKRRRLVAELLDRPEYADYWAQRWCDLLQVDKDTITPQGAVAMTRWVHSQLERNVPYDQFVRAILTARGSTLAESAAGFFQVQADPEKSRARSVSSSSACASSVHSAIIIRLSVGIKRTTSRWPDSSPESNASRRPETASRSSINVAPI